MKPFFLKEFTENIVEREAKAPKPFMPGVVIKGVEPPPPPPPSFSEAEYNATQQEHYRKGFAEGQEEGKKQTQSEQANIERQLVEGLSRFVTAVQPLYNDYRSTIIQMQQDVPRVALAIAKKVAGNALQDNASVMIEDLASRCVQTMANEPKLCVTVHSSHSAVLSNTLSKLVETLEDKPDIIVKGDDTLSPSDCRIEWQHGEFARHTGQLWEEIDRVVGGLVASATHHATVQVDALAPDNATPTTPSTNPTEKE